MMLHTFDSTYDAYNQAMSRDDILVGDILLIPSEDVVGVAFAWPFALTEKSGELHGLETIDSFELSLLPEEPRLQRAFELYKSHGQQGLIKFLENNTWNK